MRLRPLAELLDRAKVYTLPTSLPDANAELMAELAKTGDERVVEKLIKKNEPLVAMTARAYLRSMGHDLSFEDLLSAGRIGLLKAIRKYQISKGTTLSTYALHWIRQAIRREIDLTGFRIRIPVHMMQRVRKVAAIEDNSDQRLSPEQLSLLTGYTPDLVRKVRRIRAQMLPRVSIDHPLDHEDGGAGALVDTIANTDGDCRWPSPESEVLLRNLDERILAALKELKPIRREILKRRFGLFGADVQTLEVIGGSLGFTRERVRQLEEKGLKDLRGKASRFFERGESFT